MNPVLKWALENSDPEKLREIREKQEQDGTQPSALANSTPEQRAWLESMLKSDADKMRVELTTLNDSSSTPAEREVALDELNYHVEQIDNANDLIKLQGFPVLIELLKDSNTSIALKSCWVLGTCAQNNPQFQKEIIKHDALLPALLKLLSSSDIALKGKALFALSGIIRNNAGAIQRFNELQGFEQMANSFDKADVGYNRKAAHILNQFIHWQPEVKEHLVEAQAIQSILHLLKFDDIDLLEKTLTLITSITAGDYRFSKCFKAENTVGSLNELKSRVGKEADQAGYQQINEQCNLLIAQIQKA